MNAPIDPRLGFDAATIPGMRDRLSDAYARFRAREADAIRATAPAAMKYRERDCPCCGARSKGLKPALQAHGLTLLDCPGCGLTYSREVMDEAADAARYETSDLDQEAMRLRGSGPYLELETARARYYLAQLKKVAPSPGRMLEVGPGTGTLLLEAERLGWQALGVEPGAAAADMARSRGAKVIKGWFPADLPGDQREFDAICVLDVLEHFADPVDFLKQLRAYLKPRGRLLVQVPNWDSLLIRLQGAASSTVCPGHWSYFTPATLVAVLSRANFHVLGLETVVGEIDRISSYPASEIEEWVKRLRPEAPLWPLTTTQLLDHNLGYKLVGIFGV